MKQTVREEVVKLEPVAVRYRTAAGLLECSESTIRAMVRGGRLRTTKIGVDERITLESIKALAVGAA